ncbi:hypothetical protein [Polaromonas sp.]|uniref:hypothetical protein n=1 Tax=Polaromonas sp. TaxID=1869339 RepID=UPI00352A2C45
MLHKAHHVSQEIVQPGENSDLAKITEKAWKDFKGNEINAFKITCGCDWTDFLSCITHAGFRFCNRCDVVLFLGNIFVFLVCIVGSIYLHSTRKAIYASIWIISVFSSVYCEVPRNIKMLVTIYLLISPIIILVLIFCRSNNKQQSEREKITPDKDREK